MIALMVKESNMFSVKDSHYLAAARSAVRDDSRATLKAISEALDDILRVDKKPDSQISMLKESTRRLLKLKV